MGRMSTPSLGAQQSNNAPKKIGPSNKRRPVQSSTDKARGKKRAKGERGEKRKTHWASHTGGVGIYELPSRDTKSELFR